MDKVEKGLSGFLETGADWARKPTSVPGVFVVKFPAARNRPATLGVEFNPVDKSGKPIKRRGLMIRSLGELQEYKKMITDDKVDALLKGVEVLCGTAERKVEEEEVLQI